MSSPFPPTPWSRIVSLRDAETPQRGRILEELCEAYWKPVYAFARRRYPRMDAEDLTQRLFLYLLENDTWERAEQSRGRLRTFLIRVLQGVAAREWHREDRSRFHVIDAREGESFLAEVGEAVIDGPDHCYDLLWAMTALRRAIEALAHEYAAGGKGGFFERIKPLVFQDGETTYARLAEERGCSQGSLRTEVHRCKVRLRDLLRREIARGVDDPAEIDEELEYLLRLLSRRGTI